MSIILITILLLTGCATSRLSNADCLLQQKRAMQDIEPYSVAADTYAMRDDEQGAYIRLEPGHGFKEPMRRALAQWELTKLECWGENL